MLLLLRSLGRLLPATLIFLLLFSTIYFNGTKKVSAANLSWPTTGYIGYIYQQPINYNDCGLSNGSSSLHCGLDIWTNNSGTGNNGTNEG